jgi:peptidoglycan/xylan/chitin deacetylase (PgdA/CDA1 family)
MFAYLRRPVAFARFLRNRYVAQAVILIYHRVAQLDSDPFELAVTPRNFEEHLSVLSRYARPISLSQLVVAVKKHRVPRRAVVVTFDDGYADNLSEATPLLQRYDIPATFFIAGERTHTEEFWWDELEALLFGGEGLPSELSLGIAGSTFLARLPNMQANHALCDERLGQWRYWDPVEPTPRHALFRSLYGRLLDLPPDEQRPVLEQLRCWAKADWSARPLYRRLTPTEIAALANIRLVEIGGHTSNHPALPNLPAAAQLSEIGKNKSFLEEVVGRKIVSFSYPNGSYSRETMTLVQQAGFQSACTTRASCVRRTTDCFQLPRLCPGNWGGDQFLRHLNNWFRK